jgi:hypothetical protein
VPGREIWQQNRTFGLRRFRRPVAVAVVAKVGGSSSHFVVGH